MTEAIPGVWQLPGGAAVLGWTVIHAFWQAALVSGGLALVLRVVPASALRLRRAAAGTALGLVVLATGVTAGALMSDWRTHEACWHAHASSAAVAPRCVAHGVPTTADSYAARTATKQQAVLAGAPWAASLGSFSTPARSAARVVTAAAGSIGVLWAILALLALVRLAGGLRLVGRVRAVARPVDTLELRRTLDALGNGLAIRGRVDVRESDLVGTPAVAGWRSPVILLPRGLTDALSPAELHAVVAHELAHVRRRDYAVNLAQRVVESLFTMNPFVRWISSRIREEREAACDRIAAGQDAAARHRYIGALLALEARRRCGGPVLVGFLGHGSLLSRVRRITDSTTPAGRVAPPGRLLMTAAATAVLLALLLHAGSTAASLSSWAVMDRDLDLRQSAVQAGPSTP